MPKKSKGRKLVHRATHRELQIRFYQTLDPAFLYLKALAACSAYERADQFKLYVASIEDADIEIDEEALMALRAETYFSVMHQFESFFAVLMAFFQGQLQGQPDWVTLMGYAPGDIAKWAQMYLNDEISELTNGQVHTKRDFINVAIYSQPTNGSIEETDWITNLDNVAWIVDQIADFYCDGLAAYNSYKHGMRFGKGFVRLTISPQTARDDATAVATALQSANSISYPHSAPLGQDKAELVIVIRLFNPDQCLAYLKVMYELLRNVKTTRLARLQSLPNTTEPTFKVTVRAFEKFDRSAFLNISESRVIKITL